MPVISVVKITLRGTPPLQPSQDVGLTLALVTITPEIGPELTRVHVTPRLNLVMATGAQLVQIGQEVLEVGHHLL